MRVAVKLRADAAASIVSAKSASNDPMLGALDEAGTAEELRALLTKQGAALEVMHPSTTDPELQTWFMVDVADEASATRLATSLEGVNGVEAAYVQPADQLP